MNQEVASLHPAEVWTRFEELNAVPRPSKKEERVIAFMKKFGEDLGLETIVDPVGNVIIRKPAMAGKEGVTPVVLQLFNCNCCISIFVFCSCCNLKLEQPEPFFQTREEKGTFLCTSSGL